MFINILYFNYMYNLNAFFGLFIRNFDGNHDKM
jgi:hypothetical protein